MYIRQGLAYSWSSVSPLLVLSRLALRALRTHLFQALRVLRFQLVVWLVYIYAI